MFATRSPHPGLAKIVVGLGVLAAAVVGIAFGYWAAVVTAGTGKLAGLQGEVAFASGHAESYPLSFDYNFE